MNYRHAFHAGNFADVLKHIVLARCLVHLREKPAPFRVIDTHAGLGFYDLKSKEAGRTGEWEGGIGRLLAVNPPSDVEKLLVPYREAIERVRAFHGESIYPGSPEIARGLLRGEDRLILVEKHPEDAQRAKENFAFDGRAKLLERDGYEALNALVPPKEKRGLILIDPPYEERDEFDHVVDVIRQVYRKFSTGVYMIWYPLKAGLPIDAFYRAMVDLEIPKILRIEQRVRGERAGEGLAGSGLLVINPPWRLKDEMTLCLGFLDKIIATGEGNSVRCDWLAPEKTA